MRTLKLSAIFLLSVSFLLASGCESQLVRDLRIRNDTQQKEIDQLRAEKEALELQLGQFQRKLEAAESMGSLDLETLKELLALNKAYAECLKGAAKACLRKANYVQSRPNVRHTVSITSAGDVESEVDNYFQSTHGKDANMYAVFNQRWAEQNRDTLTDKVTKPMETMPQSSFGELIFWSTLALCTFGGIAYLAYDMYMK